MARLWALWPYALLALGAVVVIVSLEHEIHRHLGAMESWIAGLGLWGPAVFVAVFAVLASVFVPDSLLSIVAGVMFGLAWGLAAVITGGLVASTLQYALARSVLRDRVQRLVSARPALASLQRAVQRQELRLQVLIRLTPLSPTLTSYVLGAAGVRFGGFLLAVFALVPAYVLQVYIGFAGRHAVGIAGRRGGEGLLWHDLLIFATLAACVLVVLLVTRTARRALAEATEAAAAAPDPPPPAGSADRA